MSFKKKLKHSKFINPSRGLVEDGSGLAYLTVEGYNLLVELLAQQSTASESRK